MTDVYLSLGSNIQPRLKNLHSAINSINEIPETFVREISSIYRTEPFASKSQPFYFNSAVLLQTKLLPGPLLDQFGMIEESHGRPSIRKKINLGHLILTSFFLATLFLIQKI